jgi:hypothetical protein
MTAFNKTTDLPASIDTLEKLAFWALQALYEMHKNEEYGEVVGEQTPIITFQQGLAAEGTERGIFRYSAPMASNWASSGLKLFRNATNVGNSASVPIAYKTD